MEFVNETDRSAALYRTMLQADPGRMMAWVVVKTAYRMDPCARDREGAVPLHDRPVETDLGELPSDGAPWKASADVIVLGKAYASRAKPTVATLVSVQVGAHAVDFAVIGERRWARAGDDLEPTPAIPFTECALTWRHAYGGQASVRATGASVPHPYNPAGKGFVLERESAEGTALPNLEDPRALVKAWTDRPQPLCPGALPEGSAFLADDMLDTEALAREPVHSVKSIESVRFKGLSFNQAHPRLRVPALKGGESVELRGLSPTGPLRFTLPVERLSVRVWLDTRRYEFPAAMDTLLVLTEERRFVVTHRCHFTYTTRRGEARLARLCEGP